MVLLISKWLIAYISRFSANPLLPNSPLYPVSVKLPYVSIQRSMLTLSSSVRFLIHASDCFWGRMCYIFKGS